MKQVRKVPKQVIVAEFITGQADMQRQRRIARAEDIAEKAELIAKSAAKFNLPVYVLTNEQIDYQFSNLTIETIKIAPEYQHLSLYFLRWIMAYQFLFAHHEIEEVFFVDLGDVELLHNPFGKLDKGALYFGDESNYLSHNIVQAYRKPEYAKKFLAENQELQLLNPGVIGGKRDIVLEYLGILVNLIAKTVFDIKYHGEQGLVLFEMAIINYVAYRYFSTRVKTGRQVATLFWTYRNNDYSWFKHK